MTLFVSLLQCPLHILFAPAREKGILISPFLPQPIQELLAEAVAKGKTQDIILLLKALGNAGHPSSLKSITKILPIHGTAAVSLPPRVHVDAILALRNLAKKEPRMVNSQHQRVLETIPNFMKELHNEFAFSCKLDPGIGTSALHGQVSSLRASYARMHCVVWDKAPNGSGDNSCQYCEDRGEPAGSKLHILSHEVPDQEHCHYPRISVRAPSDPYSLLGLSTWADPYLFSSFMLSSQCCSVQRCGQNLEPKAEQTELAFQQSHSHGRL